MTSIRTMLCNTVFYLSIAALAAGSVSTTMAQSDLLEGKVFEGVFLERGKFRGDADTLTFRNGQFHSSACDQYGYSKGNYKASNDGGATRFEVETESAKYGKLVWTGFVRGEKLDATVMMMQSGKTPIENWVAAGLKK